MNDRGKSRTPLSWNVKDTTGPRNAYVLASRTLFRIIGKCDAARKWKTAAAPRNKPPTVSDRAAVESRWSGVPICASCVTLGFDGTVRPASSPPNHTAFRRFRYSTPCGHGQKPNTRSSRPYRKSGYWIEDVRLPDLPDGMRRPVSIGMRYAPNNRRARSTRERRPAVKKIITVARNRSEIFKQQQLTIGVDLGDRISYYCILDETGNVILEQSVPTTPKGMQQVFSKISHCRIPLETGTHSPW